MASKPKIDGLKILKLDQLVLGDSQARKKGVEKNIGDLMASIEAVGLIQPIVVAPKEDSDLFEVIAGQRRLLAHTRLGKETIMAVAFDQPVGELEAMLISLSENAVRQEMENPDYIDACGYLYEKYGTLKEVSDQTGIPYHMVSKYVKIDRLSDPVKDAVRSKEFTMDAALRGTQAAETRAGGEGLADPAEVLQLARALSPLSGVLQKKVVAAMRDDPALSIEEAIEGFEDLPVQIQVHLIDGELSFVLSAAQHREFSKLDLSPAELREFSELVNVETGTPDAIENWIEERREARRASGDEEPEGG